MNRKTALLFLILTFLMNQFGINDFATAQESPVQKLTSKTQAQPSDQLYLDFKGASLLSVLATLSELSGINYVAGNEIADRQVNVALNGVTIKDALEAISRGANVIYDYSIAKNVYFFRASAVGALLPPLETRVFKLYYVRVSGLREIGGSEGNTSTGSTFTVLTETQSVAAESPPILKIVGSILSERGSVNVDDRSNSLVVTDTTDQLQMVERAIAELDRKIDQVLINAVLVETFEDLDHFLGIEWGGNTAAGQEGTLGLVQGGSMETRFPFNVNEYNMFTRLFGKTSLSNRSIVKDTDVTTEGIKDFTDLDIRFRALQTAGKLKILAKPRVLVLDNHPALIKITTNRAIGSQATTAAAQNIATTATNVAERTEVGTSLRATPLINTDGRITMTLEPRFVTDAAAASGASNTRDPTIRTVRTTLMVNDGQTIVLGGLLSSTQTNGNQKVPFLGDIPFLGEIFTRRTTQIEDRELILFITPNIIRDPSQLQAVSIPDYRDRFDDLTAPFWKVKRKKWFKKLRGKLPSETIEMDAYFTRREQAMDKALGKLTNQAQATTDKTSKEKV